MKQTKKGFTLVELLVVIAILAILATVSVVGYTSFITRANLSNDQTTITMINSVLMAEEVFGKPESISEVMDTLRANGFNYEKQVPYSTNYHYGYHNVTNRFYLLDASNEVCYPEGTNIVASELWLPYRDHASSIVNGISMYYAVGTISNQQQFDSAFASGSYVLDLNGNICTVSKGSAQVVVQNGIVLDGNGFETGEQNGVQSIIEDNAPVDTEDAQGRVKRVYTNTLNPEGLIVGQRFDGKLSSCYEYEYVNCVFTKSIQFVSYQENSVENSKITFTNCKFINITGFAIITNPENNTSDSVITIDDCEFINCDRGINIQNWQNATVNITNCKFSLKTGNVAYNCIQISGYTSDKGLESLKINFTNNEVASANGIVYFHNDMTAPQELDSFKAVFGTFSGNIYATNVEKIVDRGDYTTDHALCTNGNAIDADMQAQLEALVK